MNNSIETSEREGVEPSTSVAQYGEEALKQRVRFAINNPDVLHTPEMFRQLLREQRCVIERAVAALLSEEQVVLIKLASIQELAEALGQPHAVLVREGETPEDGLIRMAVAKLTAPPAQRPKIEPGLEQDNGSFIPTAELNQRFAITRVRCPVCLGAGEFITAIGDIETKSPCSACNGDGMILG